MNHYTDKDILFDFFNYDIGNYKDKYLNLIESHLNASKEKTFLDLGCGHGDLTKKFSILFKFSYGLEPYLKITNNNENNIRFLKTDLLSFDNKKIDILLGKEMIHHIENKSLFFHKLHNVIKEKAVFITRPKYIEIPFFKKALDTFSDSQQDLELILKEVPKDKFHYRVSPFTMTINIYKKDFYMLIKSRFWSCFSKFSDIEIEQGIKEIEEKYSDKEILSFNDKIIIIELLKKN